MTPRAPPVSSPDNDNNSHVFSGCQLCVAEAQTRVFNVRLQRERVFVSSVKASQNTFVASDKHVCLQCDTVLGGE